MGGRVSEIYNSLSEEEKNKNQKEYEQLLAAFMAILKNYPNAEKRNEAIEDLMGLRAKFAIERGIRAYGMTPTAAYELIKKDNDELSEKKREKKMVITALIDNMIEFAVCEEYQLLQELPSVNENVNLDDEGLDWEDEEFAAPYKERCKKYNNTFAAVENSDVEYAMKLALIWLSYRKGVYLTYWTQNDHRVRPWHLALQGFTASKEEFPSWMIPPIEWACRCYLVEDTEARGAANSALKYVQAAADNEPEKPEQLDGIFKESVCKGGRVFSDEHPYFDVSDDDIGWLEGFVKNIREEYYG